MIKLVSQKELKNLKKSMVKFDGYSQYHKPIMDQVNEAINEIDSNLLPSFLCENLNQAILTGYDQNSTDYMEVKNLLGDTYKHNGLKISFQQNNGIGDIKIIVQLTRSKKGQNFDSKCLTDLAEKQGVFDCNNADYSIVSWGLLDNNKLTVTYQIVLETNVSDVILNTLQKNGYTIINKPYAIASAFSGLANKKILKSILFSGYPTK